MYLLPKIHKRLINVPGRPVISNCGTPTEKASKFLDHHLKTIMRSGMSYIKVTNDFLSKLKNLKEPNSHTTSNPHRFDVDFMSIRRRPNFDEFPRHFHGFFRCNFFDGRKIYVVSTHFFRCNFDGRKIYVASTHFFRCNFSSRNIHVVSTYFFRDNFDGQKFGIVFGNL